VSVLSDLVEEAAHHTAQEAAFFEDSHNLHLKGPRQARKMYRPKANRLPPQALPGKSYGLCSYLSLFWKVLSEQAFQLDFAATDGESSCTVIKRIANHFKTTGFLTNRIAWTTAEWLWWTPRRGLSVLVGSFFGSAATAPGGGNGP
jgi:hypothetical protein